MTGPALGVLRKAALLVRSVPGLGLRIDGPDGVRGWVARSEAPSAFASPTITPEAFAALVAARRKGTPLGDRLHGIVDGAGPLRLALFTSGSTTLGPHGLVRWQPGEDLVAMAFATTELLAGRSGPVGAGRLTRRATAPADVAVAFDRDPALGATLVQVSAPAGSEREQLAFGALFELAAGYGVEELAGALR